VRGGGDKRASRILLLAQAISHLFEGRGELADLIPRNGVADDEIADAPIVESTGGVAQQSQAANES
jgi:hypothetical protein